MNFNTVIKLLFVFPLTLLMAQTSIAAVYKWKNSEGVSVFSDQPHQGAKAITLPKLQSYQTASVASQALPEATTDKASTQSALKYTELSMTNLKSDATLRQNQGVPFTLQASIVPELAKGDVAQLLLDGKAFGSSVNGPATALSFVIAGVARGAHQLQIVVQQDASHKTLISSKNIRVYFHQARTHKIKISAAGG
jgi:hypothetical protein